MVCGPRTFYWVINDVLGGCGAPESPEELAWLHSQGVDVLVSLVTDGELARLWGSPGAFLEAAKRVGLSVVRLPIPDLGAPDPGEACRLLREVEGYEARGLGVAFHCLAGRGRTGTMLAAYLAYSRGLDPLEALELVRRANPYAGPESEAQWLFLEAMPRLCP